MKKVLKIGLFIISIILIINLSNKTYASNEIIRINFNDKNIYEEIIPQISNTVFYKDEKNNTIDILKTDLENIKEIYLNNINTNTQNNTDLQGIERFTNLEKLEISNYKLEDISAIKNLYTLTELKINNCQISDITALKDLKNLTKLDLGQNQIEDISVLKNLTNLKKLNLNKNQITNISALQNLTELTGLDLSSNQIKDIKDLKNLSELASTDKTYEIGMLPISLIKLINFEYLYLDDNEISDISSIDKEILQFTTAQKQRVTVKTRKKEINLPKIFTQNKKLELTNCNLNEDKTKIILQDTEKQTMVKITEGIFSESILKIENDFNAPSLMIIYEDVSPDNLSSVVTIKSDEEVKPVDGWTISENKNKLSKTYTKNGTEKLKVYDLAGNASDVTVEVKNINLPIINVGYAVTDNITVSKGNEIIAEADKYVGKIPYVLQGNSLTEGIDCSHFVYQILKICGVYDGGYLRSTNWIDVGEPVDGLENAIAGDVIVWDGHVAFYDGNGKIVEAKGKKWGLTHDRDAANAIKKSTYLGIRRFTGSQIIETMISEGEVTDKDIKVTINSSKKIKPVAGWKISENGKTLTKTYTTSTNQVLKLKDYDGNEVGTKITTNIQK